MEKNVCSVLILEMRLLFCDLPQRYPPDPLSILPLASDKISLLCLIQECLLQGETGFETAIKYMKINFPWRSGENQCAISVSVFPIIGNFSYNLQYCIIY